MNKFVNFKILSCFLVGFILFFINVSGVDAACDEGIVCSYKFCGLRDASKAGSLGIGQCAENNNFVYVDIVFRCSDPNENAKNCDSFVSWAYSYKNKDGKSCDKLENWGNYNDLFNNTDKYLKKLFNNQGNFTCPTLIAGLSSSTSDDIYKYGYGRPTSYHFDSSSVDGVENTIAWQSMYESGAKVTSSSQTCVNSNSDFSEIENNTKTECDNTVINKVEEEQEFYEDLLGKDGIYIDPEQVLWWKNDIDLSNVSPGDPCTIVNSTLLKYINIAIFGICIIAIIAVIVMTAIDFVKAIVSSEEDKLKKTFKNLISRIIVIIILLLLPMLLSFIINVTNAQEGQVKIGEDGKPFCDVGSNS